MEKPINTSYNIFGKLRDNIEDFDDRGVYLIGRPSVRDQFDRMNRGRFGGYYYSQRLTLEAIDLASASRFKRGNIDSEGKRKTYLNIVNFHKEVSMNQLNVNVSNYILNPTQRDYTWPVFFMNRKFKEWAAENSYDDLIDELTEDFCGKGTCVVKRTKNNIERVPLRTLRCTPTAKSLKDAANNGGYVIVENEMTYSQMKKYKKWNTKDISKDKPMVVFESYGLVPKAKVLEFRGEAVTDADWENYVLTVQILAPNVDSFKAKAGSENGHILYLEELVNFPLEEAHYAKMDGRWLGIGEIEKQLENQIARNLTANLRHRSLMWAAKKIFQSTDDEIANNLVMEVKDGEVLHISKPGGTVSQVNTQTQHLADFNADDKMWQENSNQISFSFETATGAAMPSATPFRLGAILDAAVAKYYKRKQDILANFLKRSFFDQIIPMFKDDNSDEHTLNYGVSHEDYPMVKQAMAVVYTNDLVHKEALKGNFITYEEAEPIVQRELEKHNNLDVVIPSDYYDNAHCYMELNINEPISGDIESLTSLYQSMVQAHDPRAERVLEQIFAIRGKNIDSILGPKPTAPAPVEQPAPSGAIPPPQMQPQPETAAK